uniref:Uncharacterized protein n=1 Tax=Rhizophora mucronata TaxID=61149 RepID=A0A2P2QQ29_RHIMU
MLEGDDINPGSISLESLLLESEEALTRVDPNPMSFVKRWKSFPAYETRSLPWSENDKSVIPAFSLPIKCGGAKVTCMLIKVS